MTQQVVTRVEDELAEAIDALVADGVVANRSEAVRLGLRRLVDDHRRQRVGQAIVDGYRRTPQADAQGWADDSTVAMIAEEPW